MKYLISAKGTPVFNTFSVKAQAMSYARQCVRDGYESVTVYAKPNGKSMQIEKQF